MDEKLLAKYAEFAVRTAVGLQKGQTLVVRCPVEQARLAALCAEAAYGAGAREVVVFYDDDTLSRLKMQRTAVEVLEDVKPWQLASMMDYAEGEGGMCILRISARDPELYKGIDPAKVSRVAQAGSVAMRPFTDLTMGNRVQWSVIAAPGRAWAQKVFPGIPAEEAVEKLWAAIFKVCRVEGGDPVGEWEKHVAYLHEKRNWLQGLELAAVHLKSTNGTDLTVGLADGHVWGGAREDSTAGVPFLPNVPTEEVFTAPHRLKTEGVVKSSLPYVWGGDVIEGLTVRFEKGVAVEYSAEKGSELLEKMLSTDEGAKHLGEIALVPASSPIRQTGLLYYNTLFDENAACHMAFGAGYPGTVAGGEEMDRDELLAKGVNDSLIHEDIMIGTADMDIDGIKKDGSRVAVFRGGEWV